MEKASPDEWDLASLRTGLAAVVEMREEANRCTRLMGGRQGQIPRINGNGGNNRQNGNMEESARVFAVKGNEQNEDGRVGDSGPNFRMDWGNESKRSFWGQLRVKMKSANGGRVLSVSKGKRKEMPKEMASQLDIPIAPMGKMLGNQRFWEKTIL
jgi:hypothetical protein